MKQIDLNQCVKITDDRLIIKYWNQKNHKFYTQRKRLPNSATNFAKEIQTWYHLKGAAKAVKVIKETLDISFKESYNLLCYARGEDSLKCDFYENVIGY